MDKMRVAASADKAFSEAYPPAVAAFIPDVADTVVLFDSIYGFHYGGQSAPDGTRRQTIFRFFLSVEKSQCLRGSNEGWTWNGLGEVDGVRMGGKRGEKGKLPDTTLLGKVPCMTENQWNQAKALYLSGKTWKAIGSELRLNFATLTSKASKEGITKVRKEMRNTVSSKETVSLETLSALVRSKLAQDAAATLERVNSYALDGIRDEGTREQILGSVAKRSALVFGWSEAGEQAQVSVNILGALPDRLSVDVTPDSK